MKIKDSKKGYMFVKVVCYYLAFLNFIDGILTYIGLKLNLIEEANVLMRIIYEVDPIFFSSLRLFYQYCCLRYASIKRCLTILE